MSLGLLLPIWLVLVFIASYARSLHALNGSATEMLKESSDQRSKQLLKLIEEKNEFQIVLSSLVFLLIASFTLLLLQGLLPTPFFNTDSPLLPLFTTIFGTAFLLIIACRVIPKVISMRFPLAFCRTGIPIAYALHLLTVKVTRPIAGWFQTKIGYGNSDIHVLSGEDLKAMADIGEAQGTIEEEERELIHSIVDFRDTEVREVMINRMDMDALPVTASLSEAIELIQTSGHSRLPLYEEHLDNILGVVYAKDLIPYLLTDNGILTPDWHRIARTPFFVPESKPLDDLLRDFQSRKKHLAIVLDDYGGTAGLITMEDVLEEIVGDIRDEFDDAEEDFHEQISESTHLFDARINLDDLCEVLNIHLNTDNFDFETLGGLIFHVKGDVPMRGDEVMFGSMKMRIESIENHRIGRVLIQVQPPTEDITAVL